jgi:hypothetical protein
MEKEGIPSVSAMVALAWRWSNFVVRPIMGAVISSGFPIGYEGQPCLPGAIGVDHSFRYDQQQLLSPLDQHVGVTPVISRLRAHLHDVARRPVPRMVFSLRRDVFHEEPSIDDALCLPWLSGARDNTI